jgi:hypothetical protein
LDFPSPPYDPANEEDLGGRANPFGKTRKGSRSFLSFDTVLGRGSPGGKRRPTAQGEVVVKAKGVASRHSRRIPRSHRARLAIAMVALVAIRLTYYLSGHLSADQGVELSVSAD